MEKKFDISTIVKEGEEIVISGIGGRFPESDTIDEFANNLYNKVDMIVDDDRRWPKGNKIIFNLTFKLK
jgi:fatty acid synthase